MLKGSKYAWLSRPENMTAAQRQRFVECATAPMSAAALTIKRQLWRVLNAIVLDLHNGHAESMNGRIQRIKHRACGFRDRDRFRNAIHFHRGGLDLYPPAVHAGASLT